MKHPRPRHIAHQMLMVRVPRALRERLLDLARRESNHLSAVTRRLLTAGLDREDPARRSTPPERAA